MLKLKLGNMVINLIKDRKGAERPGHKYIKRIPLAGGGYRYIYEELKGRTRTEETLSGKQARARQPESFDPLTYKFGISEEEASNIINFKFGQDSKTMKSIRENYSNPNHMSSQLGLYKEATLLIGIEIGEGWIHDINDAIYFLDDKYDSLKGATDKKSLETRSMIERFMNHTKILSDLETSKMNGKKVIEAAWNQSGETWSKTKSDLEYHSGRQVDASKFQFVPVGAETGQDVVADYLLVDKSDGATIDVFSLKWNSGRPISLKEGSYDTATIGWLEKSGTDSLMSLASSLKDIHDKVKKDIKRLNLDSDAGNHLRAARMKEHIVSRLGLKVPANQRTQEQLDLAADYAEMIIKKLHSVHDDPRSKDTVLNVSSVAKDGTVTLLQARASRLNKKIDKWLDEGIITIKTTSTGVLTGGDNAKYEVFGNLSFSRVDPSNGQEFTFATQEFRNSKNSSQLRASEALFTKMMEQIDNDNTNATKLLDRAGAFRPTTSKIKSLEGFTLVKAVQTTERKKMNAKYIRKELTESGKVRYIYKETNPRAKAAPEQESIRRNQFKSTVDSVDPAYKSLFEDSCQEIADEHFVNINAGCSSIRFTKDVDVFLDVLSVPQELRDNEEFTNASGSFNVQKGKMAFCISNFPDDISDVIKKAVMLHEIMHSFFYGTLRLKHKKPLTSDSDLKNNEQKNFIKESIKFVDIFGKMDNELRKKAEFDVEGAKGVDKEILLQESIKTYMVSGYATLSSEEHFAESGAYYYVLPEVLKKKEPEIYKHFNNYFKKYED